MAFCGRSFHCIQWPPIDTQREVSQQWGVYPRSCRLDYRREIAMSLRLLIFFIPFICIFLYIRGMFYE
jgi:hypothetical protein